LIAVFFVVFMTWYACCNSSSPHKILRIGSTLILGVLIVCGTALEYPHRQLPDITGGVGNHLVVIGDSTSAGLTSQVAPWPQVMQQATGALQYEICPGAPPQQMALRWRTK